QTEVSNKAYLAYLYWLQHNAEDPLDYRFALPDTQCWRRPMSYNEPLVRNYLRHNAFQYYPVVGVSWVQASQYCEWRGARINELDSMSEDSVIIRLPSELEWEYAALTNYNYNEINMTNDRYFSIRQKLGFGRGKMMHNFQRGSGDVGGLGHRPNDAGFIPAPVYMYEANDYGLYNIYGNVAEWVGDTYLPVTLEDIMEQENPGESLYNDSLKKDKSFITPDETFARIMDSLGIKDVNETEVETDITGAILRVYKGGSWRDRAYYLTPGSRRFLPQNIGADNIGFRCASDIPDDMRAEPREEAETETPGTDSVEVDKKAAKKAPADSSEVKDKATLKAEKKAEKEAAKAAKAKEKEKRKKEKEKAKAAKKEEESDDSTD
ncbi:SUMF1/EgtB/PvdO family nonheme iron enzyme, partial [bacterium]|nr:SUMF1/EgtB/PvdO family nonheme iron enzyme [bacterium]